jgi:hypothetical protein
VQWEFDNNAADLQLVAIEFEEDPASGCTYKTKIRHPVRQGAPALVLEVQGDDGQTGFRIGGPTASASERLLSKVLSDCWAWEPTGGRLVSFREWSNGGKPSWAFISDMMTKTSPPTAQPVFCLHNPKPEVIANNGASLARTWKQLLPIPASSSDSLVRASKDLALVLELPLTSNMVSIWNAGFSRPKVLTFQPTQVIESLTRACEDVRLPVSRVRTESELPVW